MGTRRRPAVKRGSPELPRSEADVRNRRNGAGDGHSRRRTARPARPGGAGSGTDGPGDGGASRAPRRRDGNERDSKAPAGGPSDYTVRYVDGNGDAVRRPAAAPRASSEARRDGRGSRAAPAQTDRPLPARPGVTLAVTLGPLLLSPSAAAASRQSHAMAPSAVRPRAMARPNAAAPAPAAGRPGGSSRAMWRGGGHPSAAAPLRFGGGAAGGRRPARFGRGCLVAGGVSPRGDGAALPVTNAQAAPR